MQSEQQLSSNRQGANKLSQAEVSTFTGYLLDLKMKFSFLAGLAA